MSELAELEREIESLDDAIDSMEAQHARELKPLHKARSEKVGKLWDMIALSYGVKRGQKRKFSAQMESILRTPYRQFTEYDINRYRDGFWVGDFDFRSDTRKVGILATDKSGGTGGMPIEIIAACEVIED